MSLGWVLLGENFLPVTRSTEALEGPPYPSLSPAVGGLQEPFVQFLDVFMCVFLGRESPAFLRLSSGSSENSEEPPAVWLLHLGRTPTMASLCSLWGCVPSRGVAPWRPSLLSLQLSPAASGYSRWRPRCQPNRVWAALAPEGAADLNQSREAVVPLPL